MLREIGALMDQLRGPGPKLVAFDIEPNDIADSTGHSFAVEVHKVGFEIVSLKKNRRYKI